MTVCQWNTGEGRIQASEAQTATSVREGIPESLIRPWKLPPQRTYILKNASVVDTLNGLILPNIDVKLSGGLITSVTLTLASPVTHNNTTTTTTTVIDLSGRYLCPGLIDSHVHIQAVPGEDDLRAGMDLDPAVSLLRQPFVARQMLARGFTAARDCGGATLALKEAVAADEIAGPRLFIAGRALSQSGGHGDRRGGHDRRGLCCLNQAGVSLVVDGVPECVRAARDQLRCGADFVKIMAGGGVASPADRLENTQFTGEEIRAVCEVARGCGTWVTAHAYTPAAVRHAVENGVMGIEHGNLIDAETARYMAERGVWLTPTLVTYDAMGSEKYAAFLPPESRTKNREVLDRGLQSLEVAAKAGVRMCLGTDLLGPLTAEESREFGIRARVLSSKEVLRSATVNPAEMLRQEGFLGQIKEGFAADLIILNRNPLDDVAILDSPEKHVLAVVKDGRVHVSRWSQLPEDVEQKSSLLE